MSPHASMLVLAAIVAVPFAAVYAWRAVARRRAADSFWQIIEADRARERVDVALHTPTTFDDGWEW